VQAAQQSLHHIWSPRRTGGAVLTAIRQQVLPECLATGNRPSPPKRPAISVRATDAYLTERKE
jgi:hypothetical protein